MKLARRRSTAPPEIVERLSVDVPRRHVAADLAGQCLVGIDPGFSRWAPGRWEPLLLHEAWRSD